MAFIRSLNLTLGPAPSLRQGIVPSLTGRSDPYSCSMPDPYEQWAAPAIILCWTDHALTEVSDQLL